MFRLPRHRQHPNLCDREARAYLALGALGLATAVGLVGESPSQERVEAKLVGVHFALAMHASGAVRGAFVQAHALRALPHVSLHSGRLARRAFGKAEAVALVGAAVGGG